MNGLLVSLQWAKEKGCDFKLSAFFCNLCFVQWDKITTSLGMSLQAMYLAMEVSNILYTVYPFVTWALGIFAQFGITNVYVIQPVVLWNTKWKFFRPLLTNIDLVWTLDYMYSNKKIFKLQYKFKTFPFSNFKPVFVWTTDRFFE